MLKKCSLNSIYLISFDCFVFGMHTECFFVNLFPYIVRAKTHYKNLGIFKGRLKPIEEDKAASQSPH